MTLTIKIILVKLIIINIVLKDLEYGNLLKFLNILWRRRNFCDFCDFWDFLEFFRRGGWEGLLGRCGGGGRMYNGYVEYIK